MVEWHKKKGVSYTKELKSIVEYRTTEYGCVKVKLAEALERRGITRNHLRRLTGIKYEVIDRYYKADHIEMVDLDFLAKVCYVLGCGLQELMEYQPPQEQSEEPR